MSVPVYSRVRFFWGAADIEVLTGGYTPAQQKSLGPTAVAGSGVGVRRAALIFNRTPPGSFTDDVAVTHMDFLNFTGGNPDDTWTTGDYDTLENLIISFWWSNMKPLVSTAYSLHEIRWYRIGTGVTPPNPPQRTTTVNQAGTASSQPLPPQVAATVSLHVAPRRSWGRAYVPGLTSSAIAASGGTLAHSYVDALLNAWATLQTDAASADFAMVVHSKHLGSALQVEGLAVDDVADIIRRRRWKTPTYRKTAP